MSHETKFTSLSDSTVCQYIKKKTVTLPFEDSSSKTKKRKVATLSASNSCELLFASGTHLWKEGRRKDAQITIKLADNKDAELDHSDNTSEEALALLLDNEMSKSQYQPLRNHAKSKKSNWVATDYACTTCSIHCQRFS